MDEFCSDQMQERTKDVTRRQTYGGNNKVAIIEFEFVNTLSETEFLKLTDCGGYYCDERVQVVTCRYYVRKLNGRKH